MLICFTLKTKIWKFEQQSKSEMSSKSMSKMSKTTPFTLYYTLLCKSIIVINVSQNALLNLTLEPLLYTELCQNTHNALQSGSDDTLVVNYKQKHTHTGCYLQLKSTADAKQKKNQKAERVPVCTETLYWPVRSPACL